MTRWGSARSHSHGRKRPWKRDRLGKSHHHITSFFRGSKCKRETYQHALSPAARHTSRALLRIKRRRLRPIPLSVWPGLLKRLQNHQAFDRRTAQQSYSSICITLSVHETRKPCLSRHVNLPRAWLAGRRCQPCCPCATLATRCPCDTDILRQ